MTAWATPMTWSTSSGTAAHFNTLRDNMKNLDERLALHGLLSSTRLRNVQQALCGVRCTASGNQTITTGTDTTVTWDTEAWDSDGFHSTSTNTDRITIPAGLGGYYLVSVTVAWVEFPFVEYLRVWIEDDGGLELAMQTIPNTDANPVRQTLAALIGPLAAADWLSVGVRQAEGVSATLDKDQSYCGFSAVRIFAT